MRVTGYFRLSVNYATHLPRSFCFPKLESLHLSGIRFTDDCCWNEQHFSNCPVLESLTLEDCTWFDVTNFCISIPTLKFLEILNLREDGLFNLAYTENGLRNCALKIDAPNLESLVYCGSLAKEYVLSSFQRLEFAEVFLGGYDGEQPIGYGAAATTNLPHDLDELFLKEGKTTDKSLFLWLKALPNLRCLSLEESCVADNIEEEHSCADHMLFAAGCIFQHLETVYIGPYSGNGRLMRWVKLILKTANALKAVILRLRSGDAINKEALMSDLRSLPRASHGCEFGFIELGY
ncbi:FBD-associated F-box protein At3g52670-like [Papaver somniferum]|uniref:FBD-associated F-box protein At3g52670-like n=1 Tax=Papaver somniferum TaxID=3469 RepID=UPI000E6FC46C|nr:FBD-associated F-box protein At3g52670-like [Papaver somniferum]